MTQSCDQTCAWCARDWWRWLKSRLSSQRLTSGRSGVGSFDEAAARSNVPGRVLPTQEDR